MNRGYDEGALYKDGYERSVHCLYLHVPKNSMGSDVHFHDYIEILYGVDCDMTVWVNDETVHFDNIAVTSTDSGAVVKQYEDFDGVKTIADFSETIATFSSMLDTLDIIVIVIITYLY